MPVVNAATQAGETHAVIEINEREIGKQTEMGEEKQKSSFPEASEAKAGLISFAGTLLIIGVILVYRHQIRGGEKHENRLFYRYLLSASQRSGYIDQNIKTRIRKTWA